MYTQQDKNEISRRIRKYSVITAILAIALIAVEVVGLKMRLEALSMIDFALLFMAVFFMWSMYLWPCIRYSGFLKDMSTGLTRELPGSIVEVSAQEDYQDGVRVLPVRIFLDKEQDERIVYLDVSKADQFPAPGARVRLNCFGRHIKEAVPA